jgi:hypothetical protein
LPFAWAESEIGASAAHLPAASDSIGAQLVYGLSKMNLQGGGPGGAGAGAGRGGGGGEAYTQRQQGQAGYADTGRGLGLGLGNSTYTGAVSRITKLPKFCVFLCKISVPDRLALV